MNTELEREVNYEKSKTHHKQASVSYALDFASEEAQSSTAVNAALVHQMIYNKQCLAVPRELNPSTLSCANSSLYNHAPVDTVTGSTESIASHSGALTKYCSGISRSVLIKCAIHLTVSGKVRDPP